MSQPFQVCPVCGGAIHPIAGRCKHCKADLVKLREQAEQAARAARMNAPAVMPAGYQGAPAPRPAPAQRAADKSGGTRAKPDSSAPVALPPAYHQLPRSTWSQRWPYAVGAVALLAIGLSIGMLAKGSPGDDEGGLGKRAPSSTPHMVPDHMPAPMLPGPAPAPAPDPGPQSALPPPGWGSPDPPPGWGTPNPTPQFPPPSPGSAPAANQFAVALTTTVCAKLSDCGVIDSFSQVLCQQLAQGAEDPEAEDRVRRGECSYNQSAAVACLDTIRGLSCTAQPADVMDWLDHAGSLAECTTAYVCN